MLSNSNPYVYYLSFLGPSCLILVLNLTVFIMVSRVLLATQVTNASSLRKNTVIGNSSGHQIITLAQVKGAFTVMVLLGVTWIFGAFAVGEFKIIFQYIFCICNSLQGFLIFIVRCLCYPEARVAWSQLLRTGTLKKHRSAVPPGTGSCYANSSSNPQYKSSTPKARSVRANSHDSNTNSVFSSTFWKNNPRISQTLRNSMGDQDAGWNRSCLTFAPLASSVHSITSGESSLDRMSTTNYVEDDDQDARTESSSDTSSYNRRMTLPLVPGIDVSSQSSQCTRTSTVYGVPSPVCSVCGMPGCSESEHSEQPEGEISYVTV